MTKQVSKALIKSDAVAAALIHVNNASTQNVGQLRTDLNKAQDQLKRLEQLNADLFGIEGDAGAIITKEAKALQLRISTLQQQIPPDITSFKVFGLEPMTWRDKAGL